MYLLPILTNLLLLCDILSKENKIITVFATHNLNLVKLLDKCFLMEGGRLIDFKNK